MALGPPYKGLAGARTRLSCPGNTLIAGCLRCTLTSSHQRASFAAWLGGLGAETPGSPSFLTLGWLKGPPAWLGEKLCHRHAQGLGQPPEGISGRRGDPAPQIPDVHLGHSHALAER